MAEDGSIAVALCTLSGVLGHFGGGRLLEPLLHQHRQSLSTITITEPPVYWKLKSQGLPGFTNLPKWIFNTSVEGDRTIRDCTHAAHTPFETALVESLDFSVDSILSPCCCCNYGVIQSSQIRRRLAAGSMPHQAARQRHRIKKSSELGLAVHCSSRMLAFVWSRDADGGQLSPSPAGFGKCRRLALVAGAAERRGGGRDGPWKCLALDPQPVKEHLPCIPRRYQNDHDNQDDHEH